MVKTAWILMVLTQMASASDSPQSPVVEAVRLLEKTPTGKIALFKAKNLKIPVRLGKVSKTEIVAERTIVGQKEEIRYQVSIILSEEKTPVFQALDLAHELVHASEPKQNPYDPNLTAERYIRHGIEGEGGEANAIAQECQAGKELSQLNDALVSAEARGIIKARCQVVWKNEKNDSKWRQAFYHLGQHYQSFIAQFEDRSSQFMNTLSALNPVFSSASAKKPYPVALFEEYVSITTMICNRAKQRGALNQKNQNRGRSLASVTALESRCGQVENFAQATTKSP